ncbi:MAG: 2-oxoglutarate dehydrogenase complex dihydrolipoyllysine-residue succinyltransferase [Phycisphaerales bacterium]|nr:2-oxoglutarate dehydrogenase complex dihydrolipoyllysine-residue succinyltransferase [Phycisphaerales bacterium]
MIDIVIPSPGESITEVRLGAWKRGDGEWVEKDEVLTEIESDKATLEILATASGVLKVSAQTGDDLKVGAVVARIDEKATRPAGAQAPTSKPASSSAPTSHGSNAPVHKEISSAAVVEPKVTSVARKMAVDKGVDLGTVEGSGPGGRITKTDVEHAQATLATTVASAAPTSPTMGVAKTTSAPLPASARGFRRERMTKLRQRIAERLVSAKNTAAMLTTFNEADMSQVMRLRAEHKEAFEKRHGTSLGFMGFFVKAVVGALEKFPRLNAFIIGDEVEYHDFIDVSVAVGTDKGLMVPVLRNANRLSIAEVERTIRELALKARDNKLTVDDMTGGTFTITNGGVYGSLMSTPILNPPQSGILGMHAIKNRAVEDPKNPGHVAIRPMMYLALSYDHRIVDGSEAVGFLVDIKNAIENPERLLLDV